MLAIIRRKAVERRPNPLGAPEELKTLGGQRRG